MKVILVRPRYASHIITPPLGLGYLAAFLKKNGVDALIVDALKEGMDNKQLVEHIVARQADAVGITCLTAFYREVVDLSRQLKQAGQTVQQPFAKQHVVATAGRVHAQGGQALCHSDNTSSAPSCGARWVVSTWCGAAS